jgi:hypothetical protein
MVIVRVSIQSDTTIDLIEETDLGSEAGVSRLLGGNALCMYGAPAGLTKLPYSLPNLSIRNPTGKVIVPSIGVEAVLGWKPLSGG